MNPVQLKHSDSCSLPEKILPGEEIFVQISPFGDYPGVRGDGARVVQRCDRKAFERVVAAYTDEILVDYEHHAETGGDTEAAAWVNRLWVDETLGLMGTFRFTDKGAEAVQARRLRFLSPVWTLDNDGRPMTLISIGLTNKPNLPVRPILNRAHGDFCQNNTVGEQGELIMDETTPQPDVAPTDTLRSRLLALFGCDEATTDEALFGTIQCAAARLEELEGEALNAEAEAAADEHKEQIANRAAFIELYVKNRETVKALMATVVMPQAQTVTAPATAVQPVCNTAAAQVPRVTWTEGKTPEERVANYLGAH